MSWVPVYQVMWPPNPPFVAPFAFDTSLLIDATGEKAAFTGRVWNKDRTTKDISRVGFRFGAVTKAGGSALTVSLQDVTSVGAPDEVQDQTVAIANADAGFVSNTWYRTAALSANRTVAFGEQLAIVVEYDGAGRLGADSVIISAAGTINSAARNNIAVSTLKTASFAAVNSIPNAVLEFTDGTFGALNDAYPMSAATATAINTGTAFDEFALEFTVPVPMKVDGMWATFIQSASVSLDFVLYDGTTPLVTVSQPVIASANTRWNRVTFAEQTLVPGATYRAAIKPTTANNTTVYDFTMSDANHLAAWPLGTSAYLATRVDAGAWTPLVTRRPLIGLVQSAILQGMPASRIGLGM